MTCKTEALLILLLIYLNENHAQPSAVITPRGYNASLDPEATFTFQCDVTGADTIQWVVDGLPSTRSEIRSRGISESDPININTTAGSFRGNISIERNIMNKNTSIICVAGITLSAGVPSEPVLFKVQGLLDAPSNLLLSERANQHHVRRLSWDEPFSLNITEVDPDIECYNVCYMLVNTTLENSQCTCVNQTEYTFLCVSVPLLFTVSAVNVVGEGGATSILHDGCGCISTTAAPSIISASEIQARVFYPLSGNNPIARFLFQQPTESSDGTCFLVYEVETSLLSATNTTNHGIQVPGVVQYSQSSVHLSLTVDSDDLVDNEQYSATITVITRDGERNSSMTVKFDTYDVQSVSGRAIAGGLELNCTFVEGSQAQSCILTVCRLVQENDMEEYCKNVTINRESPQQSGQLAGLQPGFYVVRNVIEVESDGSMTIHGRIDVLLQLNITEPPPTTSPTGSISDSPSIGGVSSSSAPAVGPIVGGVLGGITCVVIVIIVILLIIILVRSHKKSRDDKNQKLLSKSEAGTTKRESNSQLIDPTYEAVTESPAQERPSATMNDQPDGVSHTDQDLNKQDSHSPTFPLYTEVMGKGQPMGDEGDSSPELPEKTLTEEDLKELKLPTAKEIPVVLPQNLTTDSEDVQHSIETGQQMKPSPATSNQPANQDQLQSSCSTQPSEAPLKTTAAAISKGDPLYAELEHKKGKQSIITPPDMTGVQYSEIKTDEIPPRLPQKKSRKGRDQSSSSPVTSAPGSTTSLDTFNV